MSVGSSGTDVDVLIVGGGPIGLAVAIEARMAGLTALVVEPRETPIDKACGEGLMPGAVLALSRLGVRPAGHELAGISYISPSTRADHRFEGTQGLGVQRTALHDALAARAAELGAQTLRAKVSEVTHHTDSVGAAGVRASWLMACDGLHSPMRRAANLGLPSRQRRRRYGLRRHFAVEPWSDGVEVHWGRRVEAYVTPVGAAVVGIALLGPPHTDFDEALAQFPALSARLAHAAPLGPTLGAGPMLQRTRARTAGRIRLVGDAGGYVDALTGEGIRVGLAQAAAAIGTLDADAETSAARYEHAWAEVTRDYRIITSGLLAAARSPLRRGIVPVSATVPSLYGAVVERLAR